MRVVCVSAPQEESYFSVSSRVVGKYEGKTIEIAGSGTEYSEFLDQLGGKSERVLCRGGQRGWRVVPP